MAIPLKQAVAVGRYIMKHKLRRTKRYPLVTMLEPLFRCNLACVGCGKIQYPEEILKRTLTPEQCFAAVEECGAPVVTVAGGEPLIHPQIKADRRRARRAQEVRLPLHERAAARRKLDLFAPSDYLTLSIHLDGIEKHHDACVNREGTYDAAVDGDQGGKATRLPRHDQHHGLRGAPARGPAPLLRRHDEARRRRA